jgi:hypothetical protein
MHCPRGTSFLTAYYCLFVCLFTATRILPANTQLFRLRGVADDLCSQRVLLPMTLSGTGAAQKAHLFNSLFVQARWLRPRSLHGGPTHLARPRIRSKATQTLKSRCKNNSGHIKQQYFCLEFEAELGAFGVRQQERQLRVNGAPAPSPLRHRNAALRQRRGY